MLRTASIVLVFFVLVGLMPASRLAAQRESKSPSATGRSTKEKVRQVAAKKNPARNRLPKYFAQLKLDDAQREQILEIQTRYADQIDAKQKLMDEARKQLDQLRKEQEKGYEHVLKTAQRRRLKELRSKSSAARKSKK